MSKNKLVLPPCAYQGGKQRLAGQLFDCMSDWCNIDSNTTFYDLCCGSGAVTVEGVQNRGIKPANVYMYDVSPWGAFYQSIGDATFDLNVFRRYINSVPENKALIQEFMQDLWKTGAAEDEVYKFILLQAAAFGSKPILSEGGVFKPTSFRSYWLPKEGCNRKSPVNPMHPSADTIYERVVELSKCLKGVHAYREDVRNVLHRGIKPNSVIYIDPPYKATTGYGNTVDVDVFIRELREITTAPIFISEAREMQGCLGIKLKFSKDKGGISGKRKVRIDEYLNVFML